MRLSFCMLLTVLFVCVGGCGRTVPPAASLVVGDIRGDRLGMGFIEYQKLHRSCVSDLCVEESTYAGSPALKTASFFNHSLFSIQYSVGKLYASDLLRALEEKYGPPGTVSESGAGWSNGTNTIRFTNFGAGASVDFELDDLRNKWAADHDRRKAEAIKKDQ